jgi:hypothetical protein
MVANRFDEHQLNLIYLKVCVVLRLATGGYVMVFVCDFSHVTFSLTIVHIDFISLVMCSNYNQHLCLILSY